MKTISVIILLLSVKVTVIAQDINEGYYSNGDTIATKDNWIQPARGEVKQRKKIIFLEGKIKKLKKLGHMKQKLMTEHGLLIDTIASLQSNIDALQEENELLHQEMIKSSKNALELANSRLNKLNKEISRLKRKSKIITIILITESIILIAIII